MKSKKTIFRGVAAVAALAAIALLAGCAGGGAPARPAWVDGRPTDTDAIMYFVGVGQAADEATAETEATISAVNAINQSLGVTIESEVEMQTRETLDAYEEEFEQRIRQSGAGVIAGFRVEDKFVETSDDGRVIVHLLGAYERSAYEEERQKRADLIKEAEDAVAIPEAEGDRLFAQEDYYRALQQYVTAASAALGSEIRNADVKFERTISKAVDAISRFSLVKLNDELEGELNRPLPEPFEVEVMAGDVPIPDAELTASFREIGSGDRVRVREEQFRTDADGIGSFQMPSPTIVGPGEVTVSLNVAAFVEPLEDAPRAWRGLVDGLRQAIVDRRVVFRYNVVSAARLVPTGIVIVDTDLDGNPRPRDTSAAGVLSMMSDNGYAVRLLPYDSSRLLSLSDSDIVGELAAEFGDEVERVIIGTAAITDASESDGNHTVRVDASYRALELATGVVLASENILKNARASSLESAIQNALTGAGADAGERLMRSLP